MKKIIRIAIFTIFGFSSSIMPVFSEEPIENLPPLDISSSRLKTSEGNYPGSITIITEEEIKKKQYTQVLSLLKEELGMDVVQSGPLGATSSVFMRGAGSSSTLVLVDGVQANSNTLGSFDFSDFTIDNIERIEILRGAQSTLWGSDAVGGVINIITKRGKGEPTHSLSFEGGSFGTFKETLNSSGDLGFMDYSFSVSRTDSRGFSSASEKRGNTENDAYESTTVSTRLGHNFLNDGRVDFTGRFTKKNINFDAFGFVDGKGFTKGDSYYIAVPVQKSLSDKWGVKISPTFSYDFLRTFEPGGHTVESNIISRTYGLDIQNNVEVNEHLATTFGFEYEARNGVNEGNSLRETVRNKGLYFQTQFRHGKNLTLTAGVRHDINSEFKDPTTQKYEAAYRVQKTGTRIRAAYGTAFRAPSINELFFPNFGTPELKPEESKSWEVGLDQSLLDGIVDISITYFETDFKNLIEAVDTGGFIYRAQNIAKARTKGVEADIALALSRNFRATANYTFLNARDNEGDPLARRAEHNFNTNISHVWKEKLNTLVGLRLRSDTRSNSTGTHITEAFATIRSAISYQLNKNLKLTVRGENLLNKDYEENYGYGTAGISGYAGFAWTFN